MSKVIKLTQEHIDEMREDFNKVLETMKLSDGKFTFTRTVGEVDESADLCFTEKAYLKMMTLVREFDKEVAWHGLAKRGDDPEKNEYIVYDILVYPQEVTSANVTTDQEKYQTWLMECDDETFPNIRMQGHSHVNMSTSPSGVDTTLYEQILEQLEDDMFYIFLIWNKKDERTIKIYDMEKNILFESKDVTVYVLDDGTGLDKFLANARKMVQTKTYSVSNTTNNKTTSEKKETASSNKKKKKKKTTSTQKKASEDYWDRDYDEYGDFGYGTKRGSKGSYWGSYY